ncbi:extracellular solute-binding protein [Gemmiger sp.]
MKRIISVGLCTALLLSLAGCAKDTASNPATPANTTDTQMGRWVETGIDLGGESLLSNPAQLADGTLVLYTGAVGEDSIESCTRRTSTDGVNWTAEPVDLTVDRGSVSQIIPDADGTLALLAYDDDGGSLYFQAPDGTLTAAEENDAVTSGITPNVAAFKDGKFDFVSNGETPEFVEVDPADGTVETTVLPQDLRDGINSLKVVGGQFTYMAYQENGDISLNTLDPAAGTTTSLLNPAPKATGSQALCGDADGAAYYVGSDGIYRLAPGGTLPEQVVPADGTAMSISSNYPYALLCTAAGDFMVLLMGDSGHGDLYFYHYDETLPTHADTTLTVWSLADSATARLAVNAYKKAHPEVDVKFEVAVQDVGDDLVTAINDALTQLNTELLAGEGPDLLILDYTDYETYANKGMLADLSDAVPLADLRSNIIDPFVTDGKAYVLPARFEVPALCGDAGTLDGLNTLADLQNAVLAAAPRPDTEQYSDEYYTALPDGEKYALALASGEDFARLLLPTCADAMLHDGALDADALTEAFNFVKTTADYYGMAAYQNTDMGGATAQSYGDADMVIIGAQQDEYSTCSRAKYGWMNVGTPYTVIAMARTDDIFDSNAKAVPVNMIPMPGLIAGAYTPQVLLGVNANSKNLDAAKALAATFFGEDVQSQFCSDGTAVRTDCLQAKIDAAQKLVADADPDKSAGAYVGDLNAFYANCTTPVLTPVMLRMSFTKHAQAVIDGTEDVAAAVAGVQSDLALYLAEQK